MGQEVVLLEPQDQQALQNRQDQQALQNRQDQQEVLERVPVGQGVVLLEQEEHQDQWVPQGHQDQQEVQRVHQIPQELQDQ